LASPYGFIVIYPSVTQASDGCFDVASEETLTHGGGSDSLGIVSMVDYVVSHRGADRSRAYATGVSSGGMMTNVLIGAYPDVFSAGAAFAGVPFGCFAVEPDVLRWSTACNGALAAGQSSEFGFQGSGSEGSGVAVTCFAS
jgi:poly(3-hydroxybutyrate) depolymerase